ANKVSSYLADRETVGHTNHPLANDDYNAKSRKQKADPADNSHVRFDALQRWLAKETTASRLEMIKATLASRDSTVHPICRGKNKAAGTEAGVFTWAASIMVLGEQPELLVWSGPPSATADYQRFSFANKPR